MHPKSWIPKLRRSSPQAVARLSASLLLWFSVGLLLPWLFRSISVGRSAEEHISFEEALQIVAQLGESRGSESSRSLSESEYGITQLMYDTWRRNQNQSIQSISRINQEEVRAIYQNFWQQGNCHRYDAPLDLVCLDSLVSFGTATGKQFLVNLPKDPKAASLEVARRRQAYREGLASSDARNSTQQEWLSTGMAHDRALVTLIESYSASEQSEWSSGLRRWLEADELAQPGEADPIDRKDEPTHSSGSSTQLSANQIYSQAKPFVVEVWISTTGIVAPAAGILLSSNGLVLTNYHVVNDATFDFVRSADGEDFNGTIIEADPELDLALIQLDNARNLPTAKLADRSSHVQVGDTVYAIGSPLGSHWKLTTAEVIEVQSDCGLPSLQCIRTPEGFLKPGNSGGPLLDGSGQVVGVNRAIQDGTGEGVSIPIETVEQFVEQAKKKETGD